MSDPAPNFDLPPLSEKSSGLWIGIVVGVVLTGLGAVLFLFISGKTSHTGHAAVASVLQKQLDHDRDILDAERAKAVSMTQQLEAMKQAYQLGQVPDKHQAMADYTKLDAEHKAQVEKVKMLTAQYNAKLGSLQNLKNP